MHKPKFKRRSPVYGVGINDFASSIYVNGKMMPEYNAWANMLERCYDSKKLAKRPTYIGCTVSEEWHSFTAFYNWLHANDWQQGIHLDKDILAPGNKVYSPTNCCLVPQAINSLLTDRKAARGNYPQGVSWDKRKKKYSARLKINGKLKYIGLFTNVDAAERAYLFAKAEYIRSQALSFNLPVKVINALFRIADDMEQKAVILKEAA